MIKRNFKMLLWFPQNASKASILNYIKGFERDTFKQIIQDKIHSRYPSFNHYKIYVDNDFNEIDTTCSICFENGEYQLACGHIFHKHCINQWKRKSNSCPMCRKEIKH